MNDQRTTKKPVDWDELYPGRFLKAGELQGKKVTLTIKDVDSEVLEGDKGPKLKGVLAFEETTRQLALNKTNGICLREMFGRKLDGWLGKRVTLYPAEWNGEPCIRIWGSPHLRADKQIEVQLPRRKPIPMILHAVQENGRPRTQQQTRSNGNGSAQTQQRQQQQRSAPVDPATPPDSWQPPEHDEMDPEPGTGDAP